jgi:hypothetical protein
MTPSGARPSSTPLLGYAARFTFAHLALCASAIRLRPAAEMVRFGFGVRLASFCLAQRAFCAKLIFMRPAANIVLLILATVYVNPTKRGQSSAYAVS